MAKSDASDNGQNQRIDWLAEQIAYHSDLYYNQAITEISDSEFDALWDELKQLEPTHSQLQRVGAEIDPGTVKVDHMFPMRSLNKGTTEEDIGHFIRGSSLEATRFISQPKLEYCCLGCVVANATTHRHPFVWGFTKQWICMEERTAT